ncbi:GDYXXLXY domain-containing protein [Hoeflea sp. AS60]|uniref:GDYXXLXY domain-containing protein n=1 Tax=Hoeflea sp. AS60 TaxID=3135780 RepID=UPI003176E2F8
MIGLDQTLRRQLSPVIAAIVCAVVLLGTLMLMIGQRAAILRDGAEIILKTAPVDPRDLMRGDYVRLQYEGISLVESALLSESWPEKNSYGPLWLTLEPGEDGLAEVKSVSLERPSPANPNAVYLKSRPVMLYGVDHPRSGSRSLSLRFGIERYYVPEGEGLEIEKARNARRTTVAIRVSKDGEPQIARLMIDGETLYNEPLY